MIPTSTLGLGLKQPETASAVVIPKARPSLDIERHQLPFEKAAHGSSADMKDTKTV